MATSAPSDFVNVQLSAAGVAYAGTAGTVRIGNSHFDYTWKAGAPPVRVLTSEWRKCLSKMAPAGQPIFELAPGPSLSQLKSEQAQIAQQIAADEAAGQK